MPAWSLPEYIADVLPSEARKIEDLRRKLLDLFRSYGYELVMPPLIEYSESLLSGTGRDMDLRMFKLVDQISGRTMGLRADITPQVARIDAHLLNRDGVVRLCYVGSVLHTRPSGLFSTREPLQIGAEIYGHAGIEADCEIQQLLLDVLHDCRIPQIRLDLCHVDVLRAILADDPRGLSWVETVQPLLQSKDRAGIIAAVGDELRSGTCDALVALCDLYGGLDVLEKARRTLPQLPRVINALDTLERLAMTLIRSGSSHPIVTIDLGDIRGYHYHSGVMFCAYCSGLANAVAYGGRYDHVGETFGRARAATGFSLDLREFASLLPTQVMSKAIRAPWIQDADLRTIIKALRNQGEIVVQTLPGQEHAQQEFLYDRVLIKQNQNWVIQVLEHQK